MLRAILIAGVNGAGKTTFARQLMPLLYPGVPFLNADEISREDVRFRHPVAAGKELLHRLAALERQRRSLPSRRRCRPHGTPDGSPAGAPRGTA
jgi:predicted ABC-type ATPase